MSRKILLPCSKLEISQNRSKNIRHSQNREIIPFFLTIAKYNQTWLCQYNTDEKKILQNKKLSHKLYNHI